MTAKNARPDCLVSASFTHPSGLSLTFADKTFILPIERLEMPVDQIDWTTVAASPTGEKMTVHLIGNGDSIPIDAASLRYLVDKQYAAKIDNSIATLRMTPEEQAEASRLSVATRDPRWSDVGDESDLFE